MSSFSPAHPPPLDPNEPVWIFGYGSLIWSPSFPFSERFVGWVDGYARRFWQASSDHRGTPEHPGRVVTLVEAPGERCYGTCFRVAESEKSAVLAELAQREKGGYAVELLSVRAQEGRRTLDALSYVGRPGNPHFVGDAPMEEIARIVRKSQGPSGHNAAYVLQLAEALADMGVTDAHVFELANLVADPDGVGLE